MYVQVVTYALDMSESEYLDVANELAPRFANMTGLQAKLWLEDADLGRYGAVYLWEDRESMERFLRSDLFEGTNPEFVDVDSEGFSILANLTAQTQPVLDIVESRRAAPARARTAIAKKSAPATKKAAPARKKTAPARKKTAPATKKAAPATKKAAPATKKAAPAAKKAAPATKKAGPAKKAGKKSAG